MSRRARSRGRTGRIHRHEIVRELGADLCVRRGRREARAPGSRGNRQALSELAASNPAAPPPPRAANRLSASGRVCGRNDTPRQREARRPRLAAMTAKNDFIGATRQVQVNG